MCKLHRTCISLLRLYSQNFEWKSKTPMNLVFEVLQSHKNPMNPSNPQRTYVSPRSVTDSSVYDSVNVSSEALQSSRNISFVKCTVFEVPRKSSMPQNRRKTVENYEHRQKHMQSDCRLPVKTWLELDQI